MHTIRWSTRIAIAVFALALSLNVSAQSRPAVILSDPSLLQGGGGGVPLTYGWIFTLNTDVTITELGFFDDFIPGLSEEHEVGIFNGLTGQLLASAVIPAGSDAFFKDGAFWVLIEPLPLRAGYYVIGAYLPAPRNDFFLAAFQPGVFTFDPRVRFVQGVFSLFNTTALSFPVNPVSPDMVGPFGPNFFIGTRILTINVGIDIKPGDDTNTIGDASPSLKVAVLGSADFDVSNVDPFGLSLDGVANVRIGQSGTPRCTFRDVNEDSFMDLVCKFLIPPDAAVGQGGGITLTGFLFNGTPIIGGEGIRLRP